MGNRDRSRSTIRPATFSINAATGIPAVNIRDSISRICSAVTTKESICIGLHHSKKISANSQQQEGMRLSTGKPLF
jgi:flagellar biosynthesis/type III secretory pathway ATPase